MRYILLGAALAAAPLLEGAQAPPHSSHHGQRTPAAESGAAGDPRADTKLARGAGYRSSFDGYRRYNAQEPARQWRAANEAVRDAGGHVGILKGTRGQAEAHDKVKP